jgi:hypothetical protein
MRPPSEQPPAIRVSGREGGVGRRLGALTDFKTVDRRHGARRVAATKAGKAGKPIGPWSAIAASAMTNPLRLREETRLCEYTPRAVATVLGRDRGGITRDGGAPLAASQDRCGSGTPSLRTRSRWRGGGHPVPRRGHLDEVMRRHRTPQHGGPSNELAHWWMTPARTPGRRENLRPVHLDVAERRVLAHLSSPLSVERIPGGCAARSSRRRPGCARSAASWG